MAALTTTQPRTWEQIKVERYNAAQNRSRALFAEPCADLDGSPANA